jgi:hypothetical protein
MRKLGETAIESKRSRGLASRRRTVPSIAAILVTIGVSAMLASMSAFAVQRVTSDPSRSIGPVATTTKGAWVVPQGEANAPVVAVAGGAAIGSGSFNAVSCPTATECVAVGGDGNLNGVASTSTDGGSSWTQGILEQNLPDLNAIDCASASDCVAVVKVSRRNPKTAGRRGRR